MTKSAMISILLCAAVLVAAMFVGDWTKQPYLKDIAAEIRKGAAVIEPKKPSSSAASAVEADDVDQDSKVIWDQMVHEKPAGKPQPEALIFNQAQPKKVETDEVLSKNIPPLDSGSGATQPETVKHNKPV